MRKIGFRINRVKEGSGSGLTVNEGDWTKKVVDIRNILKLYDLMDENKFAMFMSFSTTGTYITVARLIPGRDYDNIAGWIYIPNSIVVTGEEILSIIMVVKEELSNTKNNIERLIQLFAKEYPEVEVAAFLPSSTDKFFAKRITGFFPLKEILGEKRYQPIYSKYRAILIKDKNGMEIVDKNVVDITTEELTESFVFCPPEKKDVPDGVTIHFNTSGYPFFRNPVRKNKGEIIDIVFIREGYEQIPFRESIRENNQICGVPKFDWRIKVSMDRFIVIDTQEPNHKLTNAATISINNEELRWHQPVSLSESEAQKATVRVLVNGYDPMEQTMDLFKVPTPVPIRMQRAERTKKWEIELVNGHTAEMTLKSKRLPHGYSQSPIKGYSIDEASGRLEYSDFGVLKQRAIGFMIAIAAFIGICLCMILYDLCDKNIKIKTDFPYLSFRNTESSNTSPDSTPNNPSEAEENENVQNQSISANETSISDAISYLDNTSGGKWSRDNLDKYTQLKGLFEELNKYQFENILKRNSSLYESKQFANIVKAIRKNQNKKFTPSSYCKNGVTTIIVSEYIDKLNNPVAETKDSKAEPSVQNKGGILQTTRDDAQKQSDEATSEKDTDTNEKIKD